MEPVLRGAGLLGLSAGGTGSAGLPQEGEGRQDAAPSQGICRPGQLRPSAQRLQDFRVALLQDKLPRAWPYFLACRVRLRIDPRSLGRCCE